MVQSTLLLTNRIPYPSLGWRCRLPGSWPQRRTARADSCRQEDAQGRVRQGMGHVISYPLMLYTIVQCRVPEEKRPTMSEFLTRANYGLRLGDLEMDFRDGEVRYKASLDIADGGELTTEMLDVLIRDPGQPVHGGPVSARHHERAVERHRGRRCRRTLVEAA